MREILFRGKRVDNSKWVEGLPYEVDGIVDCIRVKEIVEDTIVYTTYKIVPETVGQYIQQTDKNGNKVFEGDIVNRKANRNSRYVYSYVRYKDDRFELRDKGSWTIALYDIGRNFDVVGNIYDNPELLEVKE